MTFLILEVILVLLLNLSLCSLVEIRWPEGKYGLLKPKSECPQSWQKPGWIYQDTEDTDPTNTRSQSLHIDGYVAPSYVLRSFCVKTDSSGPSWPEGQYCIHNYYYNNCPSPSVMEVGNIRWDDENTNNQNRHAKPLPYYNNHNNNTRLCFCCVTNGSKSSPIQLPATTPFYLLPFNTSKCQQVQWMVATSEWIKYDKENTGTDYSDHIGTLPYYTLNSERDITMYYCYYESCNYTLNTSRGSFQSPGYPNNYTDGQLCAWKIIVPINHTVKVMFTDFAIDNLISNDSLDYFIKYNQSYNLVDRLHGDKVPPSITASSDVMFVIRSDKEFNSRGFLAMFEIISTHVTIPRTTEATDITSTLATEHETTEVTSTEIVEITTTQSPTSESSSKVNESSTSEQGPVGTTCESSVTMVIAIPIACFVVVVALVIDIWCRCRHRTSSNHSKKYQCPDMAVNTIYDCEMIVSPCSTIERAEDKKAPKEMAANESNACKPKEPTKHHNLAFDRSDESASTHKTAHKKITKETPLNPNDCNIEDDVGFYSYVEPLGYVAREKVTDDDYQDPVKALSDVVDRCSGDDVGKDEMPTGVSDPIYDYDACLGTLISEDDLYVSVD